MATKSAKQSRTAETIAYRTRGIVVNLGENLSSRERAKRLRSIIESVPSWNRHVDDAALMQAQPLGKGAADIFVPFERGKSVNVKTAWNIVHQVRASEAVYDVEPATRVPADVTGDRIGIKSGGEEKHLKESDPYDWSILSARITSWQGGPKGDGIRIAHPDTGYTRHPQIDSNRLLIALGYNFEEGTDDPLDQMKGRSPGHGTATASVIMANNVNAPDGVFGVAPGSSLVPMRVSDSVIHFDFTNLSQALYRAVEKRCHLVSMSLGGPWAGRSLGRAVDAVVAADIIALAAAGNHWPWVVYPAKFDSVLAVAACNAVDAPWKGSARGDTVDITGPGESVWRALASKGASIPKVERSSGTSYAVATLAGICALWLEQWGVDRLRAKYPGAVAAVFRQLVVAHGIRSVPGWDTENLGPGIIDAAALLAAPLPSVAPAPVRVQARPMTRSERPMAWARLQPYFPDLAPEELARAVVPSFGARSTTATRKLADVIDEVEFFVATDPAVRTSIRQAAQGRPAVVGGNRIRTSAAAIPRTALAARGSRALVEALTP